MREPGIYYDLSNADYHSDISAIGCSGMKAILRSPAFYFGQYLDPRCPPESDKETPARKFGNMVHCVLFEHHAFNDRYAVGPQVHSKALKLWKDFENGLAENCTGLLPTEYTCAQQVRESVLSIPDMRNALASGMGEVSVYAVDPDTGVRVKVRPDWVHPVGEDAVVLLDGKTFASADPEEFARQVVKMDYAMQAALYSDAYAWATGKKVLAFIFLVIEDQFPYLAKPMELDEEAMAYGRRRYQRALRTYAECRASGIWPGHGTDIAPISLPAWALKEEA